MSWEKEALKRSNIRGEHAYLEGIEDYKKTLIRDLKITYSKTFCHFYNNIIKKIKNLKP